ncbi:MAG: hypothetical protein LBJ88_03255 [Campylobacteraceae bacterium]|jgi:hypothetical protein|nr:hypothetical protein [Campylobacteraceae bacterium]
MKKIISLLIFLFPIFLNSQVIEIDERINDIYFANGVLVTKDGAQASLKLIIDATKQDIYNGNTDDMKKEARFDLLYNQTYGFYADMLETFNQKKAEHKYFWITIESIIKIAGKTTKIGIVTDAAKDKLVEIISKEIFEAITNMALTYTLDSVDSGAYKNVIDAVKDALDKNIGSYTWNIINSVSDILKEVDLNAQFNSLTTSIVSGHQVIIIAHAEGNFFANELEDKINAQNKQWMKRYIKAISVSSPANKVPFGGSHITYDNDPTINWPNRVGGDTLNPLRYRRFYQQYNFGETLSDEGALDLIAEISDMSMPEECSTVLKFYFGDDLTDLCYDDANVAVFDIPNYKFHDFEYYMQEQLISDIGTIRQNPSREYIINFLSESIEAFKTAPSQWEVTEKQEGDVKVCEDRLLKAKHKYDSSIKDMDKVYPFDKEGKIYLVNGEYVKTNSFDGVKIEETKTSEVCYKFNDENEELVGKIDGIAPKHMNIIIAENPSIHDYYIIGKIWDYSVKIDGAILREISGMWHIYDYYIDKNKTYPIYISSLDLANTEYSFYVTLIVKDKCNPVFRIPIAMLAANNGRIADLKINEKGELKLYSNFKPIAWRAGNILADYSAFIDYKDICENQSWIYE